jgi:hypothetical protein
LATKQESVVNQETNYYNEIDQILSTQYITIGPREKKELKFLIERRMTKVEKMYNSEPTEKCRFIVIVPNSGSDAEKAFDVGKRSARLIVPKVKEGHRMLRIERVGSGKETLYIPTEVAANSTTTKTR